MNKGKKEKVYPDIRIARPSKKVYEVVKRLAETEKRTLGKQAEKMLEDLIDKTL